MAKYSVIFLVNSIVTYSLENIDSITAYSMAIPFEATMNYPGNRWHILTKNYAINNMNSMNPGDRMKIAYQEYSNNPEVDNEEIFVQMV
jgi:hypothetical protein